MAQSLGVVIKGCFHGPSTSRFLTISVLYELFEDTIFKRQLSLVNKLVISGDMSNQSVFISWAIK